MPTPTFTTNGMVNDQRTEGTWVHTGRLIISFQLDNGQVLKVTLPDDLIGAMAVDALEDLKYGNS
jgi:hypothetical protein